MRERSPRCCRQLVCTPEPREGQGAEAPALQGSPRLDPPACPEHQTPAPSPPQPCRGRGWVSGEAVYAPSQGSPTPPQPACSTGGQDANPSVGDERTTPRRGWAAPRKGPDADPQHSSLAPAQPPRSEAAWNRLPGKSQGLELWEHSGKDPQEKDQQTECDGNEAKQRTGPRGRDGGRDGAQGGSRAVDSEPTFHVGHARD